MPEATARFMAAHGLRLVTAESCTAGLIAALLAEVPGAGQLLDCAYVVYSEAAKVRCLGVNRETIEHCNLTSEAVAAEMAVGALARSDASLAVANTGVTDDVDPQVPAGTQCFAWVFRTPDPRRPALFTEQRRFTGERNEIREAAARHALARVPFYWQKARGAMLK